MNDLAVEFLGVTKSYGGPAVIRDFTWKVARGVSYGLIGRNGAGKSTLLRLAMGMLRPTRGTVSVMGGDPIREAERVKRHVGYLGEDDVLPGGLRPVDLIGFYSSCYPTWDRGFAASLAERFKIPLRRSLSSLSKGQQRQVGLLCAMEYCASRARRLPGLGATLAAEMASRHGASQALSRIVEHLESSSKRLLSRIED